MGEEERDEKQTLIQSPQKLLLCPPVIKGHKVLVVDSFKKGVSVLGLKGNLSISRRVLGGRSEFNTLPTQFTEDLLKQ